MKKHLLAAAFLMSAITSYGGGYQLNLQGLRQMAMGGTGTAWPWDASTIFYNPGGLARLHGVQAYGSLALHMPATSFGNQMQSGMNSTSVLSDPQTIVPFNIYVGGPVQEDSRIALGLGVYTPFAIRNDWGTNWLGKYSVQSVSFKCTFIQPTISYRAAEWLSIGGGFVYAIGTYDMQRALPVQSLQNNRLVDGTMHLRSNVTGVGYNLGLQFRASENLQFGLTYRSQVNVGTGSGNADFTVPTILRDSFPDTQFDTQIPLPWTLSAGMGWRLNNLTLQLDLNYTGWEANKELFFNFAKNTTYLQNIHEPRNYRNTLTTRIGACYKISRVVALMAGMSYDPSPVTNNFVSPDMPDADRFTGSFGITVKPMPAFTIIAAYEGMSSSMRSAKYDYGNLNGSYRTVSATPAIGFYYIF
jgi:long-chain fatty acid transport protein